jgi:hypothetical protein
MVLHYLLLVRGTTDSVPPPCLFQGSVCVPEGLGRCINDQRVSIVSQTGNKYESL